ncbi:MAG: hypothetical protein KKA10_00685 [Euryarchaeota archaeon]|nr:hypothetical protein [Euryarchaeota archaeon]MCG2734899.1 hypothetical protein [Candidatus Methanoperedenaceae archaeon]
MKQAIVTGANGGYRRPYYWKTLPFNSDVLNKLAGTLTFSSLKIREEIGFKPKYDLYNTINETIESYRRSKSEI